MQVNDLIPESDRQSIFDALQRYQLPLIPPKHQVEYDKLAPAPPGRKLRVVNLKRRSNESLGFAVRGGFEHNIGVFVSQVVPGSQADQNGLKVGDEIVRVNGFTISQAIHEEVLNLIKGRDEIELKVTSKNATDPVTWKYVEKPVKGKKSNSNRNSANPDKYEDVKLFVNLRTAQTLGCGIISGPVHFKGIYVDKVKPNSLAEEIGIEVGDQIIEVNKTSFIDIGHEAAVVALKSSKELHMTIRKHVGLPLVRNQTGGPISTKGNQSDKPIPTKEDEADKTIPNNDEYKIETHVLTHNPPVEENKQYTGFQESRHSSSDEEEITVVMDMNM
ncbi:hypothetical protein KUTeg_023701 [Tegillarca granosa]|uniref:PDZ domain-containing protein n=1 Tax=Tegillarca granosa TaxID=220873 RepID=A0ABQ9E5D2_TEGGR|nr:hypothetical protein KUTeg_023701 [Tegillarca granosa]